METLGMLETAPLKPTIPAHTLLEAQGPIPSVNFGVEHFVVISLLVTK